MNSATARRALLAGGGGVSVVGTSSPGESWIMEAAGVPSVHDKAIVMAWTRQDFVIPTFLCGKVDKQPWP